MVDQHDAEAAADASPSVVARLTKRGKPTAARDGSDRLTRSQTPEMITSLITQTITARADKFKHHALWG
jgi:hypothetical protein